MTGSWSSFLPGLVVLAIGLAIGLVLAARLRRSRAEAAATAGPAGTVADPVGAERDLELERQDLIERRDQLYARLRVEAGEELDEADRRDLERAAARTLRRLEELDARAAAHARRDRRGRAAAAAAAGAPAATGAADFAGARRRTASPALVGFAFGAGFAALAALLLYWAARDEQPRPDESQRPMAARPDDPVHARLAGLPPESRARVEAILARLAEVPTDLDARKALAETYVVEGLFFEAFEESERILEQSPGDVDGLYFQGLIRLTMGQNDVAIELLDQALETEPGFVSARLVRGLARLRSGARDSAVEDWRAGLDAAGRSHPGLERLLALAESGASAEEILGSPPPEESAPESAGERVAQEPADAPSAASAAAGAAYRARIELAPGTAAPPGAILFVNLRIVAGAGPPSAVKRIDAPRFPLEITLDSSDAMVAPAGGGLPEKGVIAVRLDGDGNVTTREPGYPSAQAEATLGELVTLVLR